MNIYEKLSAIQNELKAPKSQYNSFSNYNYRSCEDILEAVKPICQKYKATLILGDDIEEIGGKNYVKAMASLVDLEKEESFVVASAYAREQDTLKGMTEAQITGATSSYARKYALNGLFNIDDTKDPDTDELIKIAHEVNTTAAKVATQKAQPTGMTKEQAGNMKLGFGKYAGKTLKEISDLDGNYLDWLFGQPNTHQQIKEAISVMAKGE